MAPATKEHSAEEVDGHYALKSIIFSVVTPFVLKAAVLLGIPDMIAKSGPLTLAQIFSRLQGATNPQPDLLHRILKYLVYKKILSEETSGGETRYGGTGISKWLAEEQHLLLVCTYDHAAASLHKLHEAVLHGGYPYEIANKVHVWAHDDEEYNTLLNHAMVAWSSVTIKLILEAYDGFKGAKKLVDVGGGLGMCAGKIKAKYPEAEVVNFDLPYTVSSAPKTPGVKHVGGDMFESVPEGDLLLIKSVLLNFSDDHCNKLLRNCFKSLPKGGKLVIVDLIHTDDAPFERDLDMAMFSFTVGGRVRTFEEYKELIERTGFSGVNLVKMPSRDQVIEAYKN
ncbi:anthranilate N-methyltransferase-like [Selaginella moellendorffii]|uniref:anthranilate N-methyltransferase-like n=1 Tax=Selaginella moellendorffii TaxID=88036 RepID=UPI000D1CBB6E|nr:anthranilate N-methyltransferase-like [Selaginella moellendorffii]|eukprot:XP_024545550.1 anthranilate N-methyltransferase-like [Selaginella moellendorffii]